MVKISAKRSLISLTVLAVFAVPSLVYAFSHSKEPVSTYSAVQQESKPKVDDTQNETTTPEETTEATSQPTKTATTQPQATTPATPEVKNPYDYGTAQFHVWQRRTDAGKQISSKWTTNNGNYWLYTAKNEGYTVDANPERYAVAVRVTSPQSSAMAFVEAVNGDGSLTLSAMNYTSGFNRVDTFQITQDQIAAWKFIH